MIAPCKDCPKRYAGCHAKCPAYAEWRIEDQRTKREEKSFRSASYAQEAGLLGKHPKKRHQ